MTNDAFLCNSNYYCSSSHLIGKKDYYYICPFDTATSAGQKQSESVWKITKSRAKQNSNNKKNKNKNKKDKTSLLSTITIKRAKLCIN